MNYSSIPDLLTVTLLICAFASVARRHEHPGSGLWLGGWSMIALHFGATLFENLPGFTGVFFSWSCTASLTWAAVLFMRAMVPFRSEPSSRWISFSLLFASSFYLALLFCNLPYVWCLAGAFLFGLPPLAITLLVLRRFHNPLRWTVVGMQSLLTLFLLLTYARADGADLAINAILFIYYFNCSLHFCLYSKKPSMGTFLAIAGFFSWSMVFVLAPLLKAFCPWIHIESEAWNLPKYLVASSMILLMLERQIDYNKHLALHDELTGLPNRRLFQDRLNSALERARRTQQPLALLLIDLDYFKCINDTLGHHMGDVLLKHAGQLFLGRLRRSDTLARTGGDEFKILLEENISHASALQVASELTRMLSQPIQLEGRLVRTGASIGLALFPEDGETAEQLSIAADVRMYEAKRQAHQKDEPPTVPAALLQSGALTTPLRQ